MTSITAAGAGTIERRVYGSPTHAPRLVAIPGIDGSPGSVLPLVEQLAVRRQVHLLDYREEGTETLEDLAACLAVAAKQVEPPLDLLGQSIGAGLAAEVAARLGQRVRRVVLVGAFTRGRWTVLRAAAAMARVTPDPVYRATNRSLMALACGPVGDGGDHVFFWHAAHSDRRSSAKRTAWQVGRDFGPAFAALDVPTLVLLGSRDRFVPDVRLELARLERLLDGGDQHVLAVPDAGHVLLPSRAIATAVATIGGFLG